MARRLLSLVVAGVALVALAPVLLVAALGIRLSSPGPVFYRSERVGLHGDPFIMFKFRTMYRADDEGWSRITARDDPRIFPFGGLLRRTKVDELPQLLNVLRGEMNLVGPRPEDREIVEQLYTEFHERTLTVRPGLASPGSIYNHTHASARLSVGEEQDRYAREVLPVKLALDLVYVDRVAVWYDLRIIARAVWVIAASSLGREEFRDPPELTVARRYVCSAKGFEKI